MDDRDTVAVLGLIEIMSCDEHGDALRSLEVRNVRRLAQYAESVCPGNGAREVEEKIKSDLKVTIRCIPLSDPEPGRCIFTGEGSQRRVIWAKAY